MILSAMLLAGMIVMAQSFTLKGKVTDDEGNALELATVSCLEQAEVTMTNLKGEFQIKLRSADSVVVKFSMIGYKSRTRVLRNPKTTQTIQIQLHAMDELNEVVITQKNQRRQGCTLYQRQCRRGTDPATGRRHNPQRAVQSI